MTSHSDQFQPHGSPAYQTGGPDPYGPAPGAAAPEPSETRKRNTVAIVALVVAIVGFVFALIEGAYLLGWILLPIAFVLSIVALVLRNQPKRMALAALVISIVGFVAGGIAFMTSLGAAIDESFGTTSTPTVVATNEPTAEDDQEATEEAATDGAADVEEQGTRANPYPLGATVAAGDWEITLNSFTEATDAVLTENEFNDPPADGNAYALANVTLKRIAPEEASPFEITFSYVTASGNVVMGHETYAVVPDELSMNELFEGASTTGNVVFEIPTGDEGVLRVQPDLFGDADLFFATS